LERSAKEELLLHFHCLSCPQVMTVDNLNPASWQIVDTKMNLMNLRELVKTPSSCPKLMKPNRE
jgi:hypothetical protein